MDQRRFDRIEKVVRDDRRRLDDVASTALARIGSHTHSQYLTQASGDARYLLNNTEYGHARYRASAAQSIANATVTKLAFGVTIDSTADVTRSGGTNDFTLNRAGIWLVETSVSWAARVGTTYRVIILADSASSATNYGESSGYNNAGGFSNAVSTTKRFTLGASVSSYVYHEGGAAVSTAPTSERVHISLTWLRA